MKKIFSRIGCGAFVWVLAVWMVGGFAARVSAYSVSWDVTVHNTGVIPWYGSVFVHVAWANNSGGGYTYTDEEFVIATSGSSIAAGGSLEGSFGPGTWPANTVASLGNASAYYAGMGGPPASSPGTCTPVGVRLEGQVLYASISVNVGTTNVVDPGCFTNVVLSLNDDYTNTIIVTFTNSSVAIAPLTITGPLVNYSYSVGELPCTNTAVSGSYSNVPVCTEALVFATKNMSSQYRIFAVGHMVTPQTDEASSLVAPGGSYYYSNNVPCGRSGEYVLLASSGNGDDSVSSTGITNMLNTTNNQAMGNDINSTGGGGGNPGSVPSYPSEQATNVPPEVSNLGNTNWFLPPVMPHTNNNDTPIVWSYTNNDIAGVTPAVKDSGILVYDAVISAEQQAHSDAATAALQAHTDAAAGQAQGVVNANAISGTVGGVGGVAHADAGYLGGSVAAAAGLAHADAESASGGLLAGIASINGNLAAVSSNLWGSTAGLNQEVTQVGVLGGILGVTNLIGIGNATLVGISNVLAFSATNGGGGTGAVYGVFGDMTNASAAEGSAQSWEDYTGLNNFVAMLSPTLPAESAGAGALSMAFCGQTLNFDPVVRFPSAVSMCFEGFKIAALLGFFLAVGGLYWKFLTVKATTQVGGLPVMDVEIAGFGGNVVGFVVGRMVSIAFIVLFSAASAYIFANIGASIADAMNVTAFTSQIPSTAWYLLESFFPVRLIFSLACTLIVLQFTLGKLVNLAVSASRFLVGR